MTPHGNSGTAGAGVWFHRLKTSPYSVVECKAGTIHELRRKEGEGNG